MAGFREFVTGEVLTASNVDDFLMKQTVQKYADAAARDAALGTAVAGGNALREGMVAYLDDEDEVQYFDGTVWDAISQPIAGIGSNVVSTLKTDVFTTTSTSFVPITGLAATITPTSGSSLVLVTFTGQWNARATSGQDVHLRVDRGGTPIAIGDAAGSRTRASWGFSSGANNRNAGAFAITVLDNPATTSATTYTLEMRVSTGTGAINSTVEDSDFDSRARTVSTVTLVEVAA